MSNITGGGHFQRQQKEEVILQRNFLDEADFKKFSDLNDSGVFHKLTFTDKSRDTQHENTT